MNSFPEPHVAALLRQLTQAGDLTAADGIHKRVLSIYDHWLSEEEADHDIISFSIFTSLPEYRFYLAEEDKFVRLFAALFRRGDLFYIDREDTLLPLDSWPALISLTTTGLREQGPFFLYAGPYQVILASAHDLNVAAYFLNLEQQEHFAELARAYQLHLL